MGDRPAVVSLTPVSADFFNVLMHGAAPLRGRWLEAVDERPGAELAAVVSEGFWRRTMGADPGAIGRWLTWAGSDRTVRIVGIAPRELDYPLGHRHVGPDHQILCGTGIVPFRHRRLEACAIRAARSARTGRLDRNGASRARLGRAAVGSAGPRRLPAHRYRPHAHPRHGGRRQPADDDLPARRRGARVRHCGRQRVGVAVDACGGASIGIRRARRRWARAGHAWRARCSSKACVLGALGAIAGLLVARLFLVGVWWLAPAGIPTDRSRARWTSASWPAPWRA